MDTTNTAAAASAADVAATTKAKQLDFKILVDQTLNSLNGFDPVSRCDALHYLLQNLKFKYSETCEKVVPSVFAYLLDRDYASTTKGVSKKQLQLLLATKKEDIKNEDENASSTDLNQNFEKILCKEEFMCLDEDDGDYADDADNENSNFHNKRIRRYPQGAAAAALASGGVVNSLKANSRDPLDLIPSSVIHARRLGRIATTADGDESNSLDALAPTDSLKRTRRRAGFAYGGKSSLGKLHQSRLLFEKLQRVSHLGEGYVFHPDNEFTIHFHWRSEELSIRVFQEQFRLHLKIALKERNKEFLRQFQQDFVFTGRLLGTTPPKHVLESLRLEHEEEWRQQKIRKQQQQQQQMLLMQQRRRILAASSSAVGNAYDSEMDFELESESQLSSASQEIMKFEEIIDEGMGPGRLIDGLVMEPEIEDVIERSGSGASVSVSGGSSNSGNGMDTLPNDMVTTDSASTLTSPFIGGSGVGSIGGGVGNDIGATNFKNHLSQQQQQQPNSNTGNLLMNGLTPTAGNIPQNNLIPNNLNQQQSHGMAMGPGNHNMMPKDQQQQIYHHQQQQQQHVMHNQQLSEDGMKVGAPNMAQMPGGKPPQQPHQLQQQQQHNIANLMNNNLGQQQQQQQHFQGGHQQQTPQQRYLMQQQQQQQQQMHQQAGPYNSQQHMPAQNHPLAMMGGMMESANQQHQQMQQQRMQINATNNAINSIDNILGVGGAGGGGGGSAGVGVGPKPPTTPDNLQYMQQQQQQTQQMPPHMQTMPTHMMMQQQQQPDHTSFLTGSGSMASTNSQSGGILANPHTPTGNNSSANASFDHDDPDMSHDEDDEDHENDTNDGMEPKQQLIDGGSSSSTSLQATPGGANASGGGSKKEKPIYNCLLCPKSYRKRKSLLDHYKIHPGYCHDCGKANGTSLEEIIHHNRTVHAKDFPFVCETCGESYSRRQQFHAHVESHNKKEFKTYSCIECGQKFSHKKLHQQHLDDTGHKADGAICEVCGDEFPSKNALYQHIVRVHKKDNLFECHICQNRFTLKANLERHVQLHTEIKRTYVCDICNSSYFTYPALKDHYSNAHTDSSECKCPLCGKRFGSVKSLQRHLPSHSEERPHSCCYCEQTFKWKTHLVRHKQTVHGNQPSPKKVKRFAKEELVPMSDVPGPPPAKVAKKSNASKPKQQAQQQTVQQQQQQQKMGAVATPPPLSTTPGTSSSSQQDPFNAAIISNNSSQSSTASTSQHSLQSSESQPNSMYSQNFSAEKLLGQQQQQQPHPTSQGPQTALAPQQQHQQQQQAQPMLTPHSQHPHPQQQQRPTPPPHQQQQHHRHTPNNSHTPDNNLPRINSFGGGGPTQPETQFHFDQSAAGGPTSTITNPGAYPQHQIINQYQQQHHQQQMQTTQQPPPPPQQQQQQQQAHMRSHTPQSPHPHSHVPQQHPHFSSPHQQHLQSAAQQQQQHQQQMHHHQHMMQQQLQHQQATAHQRHNQQRSPHPHQTPAQQLQQQHQQPMHSPQHTRLQSPQAHTPQPQATPQQQQPGVAVNHQQQQQQQYTTDAWGNINFVGHGASGAGAHPQQQQQQQQQQTNASNLSASDKDNPNKFYIVDSSEFMGLPINVSGSSTPGAETNQLSSAQQPQSPMVANKTPQQQHQEQDLMSFQNMWPQANQTPNQMAYSANGGQQQTTAQQQQQVQQQQTQQPQAQQAQQQAAASQQAAGGVANVGGTTDPHSYNNIGSILTNLIDNNPNPMEYNFELMQQGSVPVAGGTTATSAAAAAAAAQSQQQQQSALGVHHQQQQQQHQAASAASAYGLQPTAGASGLIRHAGVYGAPGSLYDPHHHAAAHHASSLADMGEQQKNSFQPYHPHALQTHAHALGGHPLAPTAHHPLAAASHLLPPPPPHASHPHVYDRGGYSVLGGDDGKAVLPPISDYMHHMQQQHVQQPDLLYYSVKND
uniref:C2H2-type domain-containing protein n=1 Tax=Musca domestica TaxID=7370 RepID=A0A1I8MN48_MUSDO